MDLVGLIKENVIEAMTSCFDINDFDVFIERPDNPDFGDYSTNVSFKLAKIVHKPPMTIAEILSEDLKKKFIDKSPIYKIEYISPGFVNFYISPDYLVNLLTEVNEQVTSYGRGDYFKGNKTIVEYTDPNPFKVFHIGHLMPNVIGESIARLYSSQGAEVKRANYQGDVGMHVAKSLWGMQKLMKEENVSLADLKSLPLKERIQFLGRSYVLGATAYKEKKSAVEPIKSLNAKVYSRDPEINEMYELGRSWSLEYFETLYKRLGTKFDYYYFERETGEKGLQISEELLKKNLFEESDGAIVFRADKYGLHTRVFVNSQGLPTYESKDLGLAMTKYADYSYDTSIIVTDNEVDDYFKVVLKALYLIHPELAIKTKHISHGQLRLKSGKMSSRTGKVIAGDTLMNMVRDEVLSRMEDPDEEIADQIGIAAIKYGILKNSIGMNIVYDEKEWLSMSGDTGPYLQYTCVRARSIINSFDGDIKEILRSFESDKSILNDDELSLLRLIQKFPEIIKSSAVDIHPNNVCTYLNALAREYNSYYAKTRVLDTDNVSIRNMRLLLTNAISIVLSNGLNVLGITVPLRM